MLARLRRAAEGGDRAALDEIDLELGNCRTAWRWALARGNGAIALNAVRTLLAFCDHRLRLEDGLALLARRSVPRRGRGAASGGARSLGLGPPRVSRRPIRERRGAGRAVARIGGTDEESRLQCLKVIGACSLRLGRLEDARRAFQQALKLQPARVDPRNAAAMLDNLALVEKNLGRYAESRRLSLQSLVQHRVLNEAGGEALCLNNLGTLLVDMGEYDAARAHLRDSLALSERHGLAGTRALALLQPVRARSQDGRYRKRRDLRAARRGGRRGDRPTRARCGAAHPSRLARDRRRDFESARKAICDSLEIGIALARPSVVYMGLRGFAELLAALGEPGCARSLLAFCAADPAIAAAERDLFRALLDEMPPGGRSAWPAIAIEELAHRIVIERDLAHAPLIAALRGRTTEVVA
jgi:tetratricopeptide (TPR) repeat protein